MKRSLGTSDRAGVPIALDLDRDLPTTAEDVERLRRLRDAPVALEQVMAAVRAAGPASLEQLRSRGCTRGLPFTL